MQTGKKPVLASRVMAALAALVLGCPAAPAKDLDKIRQIDLFGMRLNVLGIPSQEKFFDVIQAHMKKHKIIVAPAGPNYLDLCIDTGQGNAAYHASFGHSETEGRWLSLGDDPSGGAGPCESSEPGAHDHGIDARHHVKIASRRISRFSSSFPRLELRRTTRDEVIRWLGKPDRLGQAPASAPPRFSNAIFYAVKRDWQKQKSCEQGPAILGIRFHFDKHGLLREIILEDSILGEC